MWITFYGPLFPLPPPHGGGGFVMLAGRTEAPGVPPRLKKSRQRQPHASAGGGRGFRPIRLRRAAERARRIDCKAAVAANRS